MSRYLRLGGNNDDQFIYGKNYIISGVDMPDAAESYLVAREEYLREAAKKKTWDLILNIDIGSTFNKTDVNKDKELYDKSVPKGMQKLMDQMTGYFNFSSWDNNLIIKKNRHELLHRLNLKYRRSAYMPESGKTTYQETDDYAELYNKYTYDIPSFILKPYVDMTIASELHPGPGKHPFVGSISAGFTRNIPFLWMDFNIGLDGSRNYAINENAFGIKSKITIKKSFSENSFFTQKASLFSDTNIIYKPTAKYHMAFALENTNIFEVQIWRKFNLKFDIKSFLYQDNRYKKLAVGLTYDITLVYSMKIEL